jgi:hypothetical protein
MIVLLCIVIIATNLKNCVVARKRFANCLTTNNKPVVASANLTAVASLPQYIRLDTKWLPNHFMRQTYKGMVIARSIIIYKANSEWDFGDDFKSRACFSFVENLKSTFSRYK